MTSTFREPIKVVADILQYEMGLSSGRVMLADQKNLIANEPGIYISLEYVGPSRVIANTNNYDPDTDEEVQKATTLSVIQIDIMSFDGTARTRKEEIAMALASVYSQKMQETYQCQIARMPGQFNDTSNVEASAMLKRYTSTVAVTALFSKQKSVEYYSEFENPEVHVNE